MDLYSVTHGPMLANFRVNGGKIVLDGVEYAKKGVETMPRYLDRVQQSHMAWMREQEYQSERKRSKEAKKSSKEGSVASASTDQAVRSASSSSDNQSSVQEIETPLEDIIRSKIAYYMDRLGVLKEKQQELEHRVANIAQERGYLLQSCSLAKLALEVYLSSDNNNNKQEVSQEVGPDLSGQVIQGGQGQGTSLGQPGDPGVGSSFSSGADGVTHAQLA